MKKYPHPGKLARLTFDMDEFHFLNIRVHSYCICSIVVSAGSLHQINTLEKTHNKLRVTYTLSETMYLNI